MIKRLVVGLLLGAVLGGIAAAVLVQGLGVASFEGRGATAYIAAAILGLVTGLVAGKPIWSADGKIEAGLKAFFGMVLALGGMYVLQRWVRVPVDRTALKAGRGALGLLPAASLPILAGILAGFFELDNTSDKEKKDEKDEAKGAPASAKKVRVQPKEEEVAAEEAEAEEAESPPLKKKR
jgi:hypothetical protein